MNMFFGVAYPMTYFYIPLQNQYTHANFSMKGFKLPSESAAQDAETLNVGPKSQEGGTQSQRVIVTREDLLQKGYEQKKKSWSEKEDKLLMKLCSNENARFEQIAQLVPNRNAKMCYSRYRRLTNQMKQPWTKEQDSLLQKLVLENGGQKCSNWKQISKLFANRNHNQVKDRYMNYLRPDLNKCEWTLEEDLLLIELINKHHKDWKTIEGEMVHRSRNQIKNRYFGRIIKLDQEKKKRLGMLP